MKLQIGDTHHHNIVHSVCVGLPEVFVIGGRDYIVWDSVSCLSVARLAVVD